ncbi:MAG: TldD/PmbA family protein [Defluviitaleaceae bacterium]|nr:TldD/PmbA family protein [Defluviitaleaceae bacterium]
MIRQETAARVLEKAMSTGGGFAELFIENTLGNTLNMVNGVLEKAVSGTVFGCGLRVFHGHNAVYTYSNDVTEAGLMKLAQAAAGAIADGSAGVVMPFAKVSMHDNHKIVTMPSSMNKADIAVRLRQAHDAATAYDKLITQTNNTYRDVTQDVLIINSDGLWAEDRRVYTRVSVQSIASDANEKQIGNVGPGARKGGEFLDSLDMAELGRKTAETAVTMLKADFAPGGEMPVVIDNGFGGVIFHEACGHSFEGTFISKGASVFAGKLGQKIASDVVTAIDDGTIPNAWGSLNIDDEGTKAQRNVLIENGILKSYFVDKLTGLKMGLPSTGSCRRESYKFCPTSRMNNTYIANGKHTPEEVITATEYGLYAKKMGGGSVMPTTGEFNFAVLEGYMICNGKIAEPVRGATLIGKGHEVLMDIDMVANNMEMDAGMCGQFSGSIPTNVGQPTLRVSKLTVGGRK